MLDGFGGWSDVGYACEIWNGSSLDEEDEPAKSSVQEGHRSHCLSRRDECARWISQRDW